MGVGSPDAEARESQDLRGRSARVPTIGDFVIRASGSRSTANGSSHARPTFDQLIEFEPRLRDLEAETIAIRNENVGDDAFVWPQVKAKLNQLIGWWADDELAVQRHPELASSEAWEVVVNHLCERFIWL